MYDISSVATYYFRKSGFKSTNSKKLPEIAKACEVKKNSELDAKNYSISM